MANVSAPKTPAGFGWLAVAGFAVFVAMSSGGEFSSGFSQSYCNGDRYFGQEGPRPGCGNGVTVDPNNPTVPEVAQP